MRRKPSVLLISIAVHAVVLGLLGTAPWWSPITNWPMPREVLAFTESPRLAALQDIELPRAPRTRGAGSPAPASAASPELAPLVAPTGVAPETARDGALAGPLVSGIETSGTGAIDGVGVPDALPPPPPPARPQEPIRPGGQVRAPSKLVHVAPQYPAARARVARAGRGHHRGDDRQPRERRIGRRAAIHSAARSGGARRGPAVEVHADAAERRRGAGDHDGDGELRAVAVETT